MSRSAMVKFSAMAEQPGKREGWAKSERSSSMVTTESDLTGKTGKGYGDMARAAYQQPGFGRKHIKKYPDPVIELQRCGFFSHRVPPGPGPGCPDSMAPRSEAAHPRCRHPCTIALLPWTMDAESEAMTVARQKVAPASSKLSTRSIITRKLLSKLSQDVYWQNSWRQIATQGTKKPKNH